MNGQIFTRISLQTIYVHSGTLGWNMKCYLDLDPSVMIVEWIADRDVQKLRRWVKTEKS